MQPTQCFGWLGVLIRTVSCKVSHLATPTIIWVIHSWGCCSLVIHRFCIITSISSGHISGPFPFCSQHLGLHIIWCYHFPYLKIPLELQSSSETGLQGILGIVFEAVIFYDFVRNLGVSNSFHELYLPAQIIINFKL